MSRDVQYASLANIPDDNEHAMITADWDNVVIIAELSLSRIRTRTNRVLSGRNVLPLKRPETSSSYHEKRRISGDARAIGGWKRAFFVDCE